ncbi:aminopeptidase N [Corynebacterium sp. sy017]|uniref:aminopeptidase N n=1 Tax=unclassified Corynebacterium TaxID=2624378 RepID=UPI0011861EBC|nr:MULTISPECIES: aminopeptidase N [unclassified Corynebacterium]MBP3088527.1 aminopeptidase N [Corynebacterium sp. sy017]TSD91831.1 aminopeptidase N [Corynebacterium sp. SY003]
MASSSVSLDTARKRSAEIILHSQAIHLDLSQAPQADTFPVHTTLTLTSTTGDIELDYLGQQVDRVTLSGTECAFEFADAKIRLRVPARHMIQLDIWAHSQYSRTGQGLHRFHDPHDNTTYVYSHSEPSDARRIFPCFDQPDLKTIFHTSLTVPAGWVGLSNQKSVAQSVDKHEQDTTTTYTFAPTPALSSYLVAFAAGPYVCAFADTWTSPQGQEVEIGVWTRASMARYADAEISEITAQGLSFFHENFGFAYPWGKYDSIFVPEYNLGAMENPGLVTFTESYIFRSRPTQSQHAARANTILHEMSHMWFGDLVTPRWWDDLWLKESFAEYMGADASVAATTFTQAWAIFAGNRKNWAYVQDQLPTTHPIKADIPDVDAARQNFDGITYAKGAAVLKQLVHFVGKENFYAAARDYFRSYAFSSATFDDFLTVLSQYTEHDLQDWATRWLRTSGPDELRPELQLSGEHIADLTIHQRSFLPNTPIRPHRVNVGFYHFSGTQLIRTSTHDVLLDASATPVPVHGMAAPDLIVVNDDDHTYAKISFDQRSLASIKSALSSIDSELSRAVIWTALWNLTRDGELSAREFVDIAAAHSYGESNTSVLTHIVQHAFHAARYYTSPTQQLSVLESWSDTLWVLVRSAPPASDQQLVYARGLILALSALTADRAAPRLRALLGGEVPGLEITHDVEWSLLKALAAIDALRDQELEAHRAQDTTLDTELAFLEAQHCAPEWAMKEKIAHMVGQPGAWSNDQIKALLRAFNAPHQVPMPESYADEFFAQLNTVWQEHPIEIANLIIRGLYPHIPRARELYRNYLATAKVPSALGRILAECDDQVRRQLHCQQRTQPETT